tara:strand:- start:54 stop:1526 length:1473 start_codon:yes stop_codon:yes gene_type:complete
MKYIAFLFLFLPFVSISQVQIGDDIDGEAAGDKSGNNVSLSANGNIVAISSPFNNGNGTDSGHVRVYENLVGVWTQIGEDIDGESAGDLSYILSLSSNGNILAIGGLFNDGTGINSGHVRIYENLGGIWIQIGEDIDGEAFEDLSGFNISISSDGSIVAIGAVENDGNGSNSGHVRVYENLGGVWTQIGEDIDGEAIGDGSGNSVSISENGSIVAIGARLNDENGVDSGHVKVYENLVGVWTQIGQDIDGEMADDRSGWSIELSADGGIVAIGSPFNDGNGDLSGNVRVYENLDGVWTQMGADIDGETIGDLSGFSVSLSSNGKVLAIGGPVNDGNGLVDSGHVRVYENLVGVWTQVTTDIGGEAAGDNSGNSVSLSSDGRTIAIGAELNSGVNGFESGHVRLYNLTDILSVEKASLFKFNLYPNPTKTQFTIQLDPSIQLKQVTIYNTLGQLVLESKDVIVNTSTLAAGSYVVEATTSNGKTSKKLIIE